MYIDFLLLFFAKVIQSSGSLQKLLAFAAESIVPEVQQSAVSTAICLCTIICMFAKPLYQPLLNIDLF